MDQYSTAFVSWNQLRGFLQMVRDEPHDQVMRDKDIDYWQTVFLSCDAIAMNSYDLFGCRLTKDIHMPRFHPSISLDEQSQTLLFPNHDSNDGNPILWHLHAMFQHMVGDSDERTILLQNALLHINSIVSYHNDLESCMEAFASCRIFTPRQTERISPAAENRYAWP